MPLWRLARSAAQLQSLLALMNMTHALMTCMVAAMSDSLLISRSESRICRLFSLLVSLDRKHIVMHGCIQV